MPIFSHSRSLFSYQREQVNCQLKHCAFFLPSWFLLRMGSEQAINKSKGRCYRWQQNLYVCRAKGRARKGRKSFPKNPKPSISLYQQALRWASSHVPLT